MSNLNTNALELIAPISNLCFKLYFLLFWMRFILHSSFYHHLTPHLFCHIHGGWLFETDVIMACLISWQPTSFKTTVSIYIHLNNLISGWNLSLAIRRLKLLSWEEASESLSGIWDLVFVIARSSFIVRKSNHFSQSVKTKHKPPAPNGTN